MLVDCLIVQSGNGRARASCRLSFHALKETTMDESKPVARGDMKTPAEREREGASNPLGTHPVGTAVGGAAGAVATGAAVGSVAGPVGAVVGAAIGAAAGGMAGKLAADYVDPQMEDEFWRKNWSDRKYTDGGFTYDQDWGPAYRYGVDAYTRYPDRRYDEMESDLSAGWSGARGGSRLEWDRARHATREAWQRVSDAAERAMPGDSDRDGR
jgi:hypothetical protein